MHRTLQFTLVLLAALSATVEAQVATPASGRADAAIPRSANDSLFRRARRLVSEGNGVAGRSLVDSLLAAADPSTPAFGDALYWHGAIAPTAAEAERDYRRVIVEYPLAFYSGDALLAIAELEQARGDRAAAMQHLQRFVREHPENPGRGIAALGVARLAFEQRDSTLGCAMLADARASVATTDVELRNQIDYFAGRCPATVASRPALPAAAASPAPIPTPPPTVATEPASPATASPATASASPPARPAEPQRQAAVPTVSAAARQPAKAARVVSPPASKPVLRHDQPLRVSGSESAPPRERSSVSPTVTRYTIQVAAYDTRADADRLVAKLAKRGIAAHVSGTSKPFRVRLAQYRTRKEAANEVLALKRRGIVGFVAEEAGPVRSASP